MSVRAVAMVCTSRDEGRDRSPRTSFVITSTRHLSDAANNDTQVHPNSMKGQPVERTSITVAELRQAAEDLLNHLEKIEGDTI